MALVDVGIKGLEFDVPDHWGEDQVRAETRTRYPFLFPDLVEQSRAAQAAAATPPPPQIDLSTAVMAPPELTPAPELPPRYQPPTEVVQEQTTTDPLQAYYESKFPTARPPRTDQPGFLEALAKEYLGTVGSAVPSMAESYRMLDAATGGGLVSDLLSRGLPALAPSAAAERVEAIRLGDPMFEAARNFRQQVADTYDYNRTALPAPVQKAAEWIGGGLGSTTTFLPAALLPGPMSAFGVGGGLSFNTAYEEARAKGADPLTALAQSAAGAGIEGGSEYVLGLPGKISKLFGKGPKSKEMIAEAIRKGAEPLLRTLGEVIGQEGLEEVISGTAKDLMAAYVTKSDPSRGLNHPLDFLARRLDDFMGGAVGGAAFTPAVRAGNRAASVDAQIQRAQQPVQQTPPQQAPKLNEDAIRRLPRVRARARGVFATQLDEAARRQSGEGVQAVADKMVDLGYEPGEVRRMAQDSVDRLWTPRAQVVPEGFKPLETTPSMGPDTFERIRTELSIPKDVEVLFDTTSVPTIRTEDGKLYTLPGFWDGTRITVWTHNIQNEAHLRAVLAEENNHRLISSVEGQEMLRKFLADHPVSELMQAAPEWLRKELVKYQTKPALEVSDEFVAKLGAEPAWKRWSAEWLARAKRFLGMKLTADQSARLLLRQLHLGNLTFASPGAKPVEVAPETDRKSTRLNSSH